MNPPGGHHSPLELSPGMKCNVVVNFLHRFRFAGVLALVMINLWPLRPLFGQPVDERLAVAAKVNGQPVKMAFDTGSDVSVLFRPAAQRLGLSIVEPPAGTQTAPGQVALAHTAPVQLAFWSTNTSTTLFVANVPAGMTSDIDGVLGWAPLRNNIFTFDAVNLHMSNSEAVPADALHWITLPIRASSASLVLETPGPAGHPGVLPVDTGMSEGVALAPAQWRAWRAAHPQAPRTLNAYYMPAAGLVVNEVAWADDLPLGPLTLHGVPVREANAIETGNAGPDYVGTLGIYVFKRTNLVLDGKGGEAYFQPLTTAAPEFQHNRLGAVFTPRDMNSDPMMATVLPGTPAAAAGLQTGDVLLKIDDLDVTKWRTTPGILPLSRFWQKPAGTKLTLTLKRGDKEFQAAVTLRDLIGPHVSASAAPAAKN